MTGYDEEGPNVLSVCIVRVTTRGQGLGWRICLVSYLTWVPVETNDESFRSSGWMSLPDQTPRSCTSTSGEPPKLFHAKSSPCRVSKIGPALRSFLDTATPRSFLNINEGVNNDDINSKYL